jgi:hypothetical protein
MGRTPAPAVIQRLSLAEQRVLMSFLSGRLPAGQVHDELQRARTAPKPSIEPQPQAAPAPQPVVVLA